MAEEFDRIESWGYEHEVVCDRELDLISRGDYGENHNTGTKYLADSFIPVLVKVLREEAQIMSDFSYLNCFKTATRIVQPPINSTERWRMVVKVTERFRNGLRRISKNGVSYIPQRGISNRADLPWDPNVREALQLTGEYLAEEIQKGMEIASRYRQRRDRVSYVATVIYDKRNRFGSEWYQLRIEELLYSNRNWD